jgi:hypothetical protein
MKIAVNPPQIMGVAPTRPTSPPSPPVSAASARLDLTTVFPIKLSGGIELTAHSALLSGLKSGYGFNPLLPVLQGNLPVAGSGIRVISPSLAAAWSKNPKVERGFRDFTTLLATHCGPGVKLVHDAGWLGHDFIVFYRHINEPEFTRGERAVELGEIGAGVTSLLGGLLHTQWLDHFSSSLHFGAVIGDHLNTGKLTFSQSDLVGLSSMEHAEEYSTVLEATELLQPSG